MNLTLQKQPGTHDKTIVAPGIMLGTAGDGRYWTYRVVVAEGQAVLGFPKFGTIGIGFEVEEDWNTNLPYRSDADVIFAHIKRNKGHDLIPDIDCIAAIEMIQEAADAGKGTEW